jgi:hypothetical protein
VHYFIMFSLTLGPPHSVNRIGGVLVSVLASSAVDCRFELRSCPAKDYKIGISCFSANHAALTTKRTKTGWLAQNQGNMSEFTTFLRADCCFSELALLV